MAAMLHDVLPKQEKKARPTRTSLLHACKDCQAGWCFCIPHLCFARATAWAASAAQLLAISGFYMSSSCGQMSSMPEVIHGFNIIPTYNKEHICLLSFFKDHPSSAVNSSSLGWLPNSSLFPSNLESNFDTPPLPGDPAATANILQEAAAQHESSKLVLKVLDACTEKLPAWIACCGPSRLSRSLQQQSLHHEGQEQDEGGEDSLVSVLTLAVQHLVAVYSRVHAACASSSLVATGITRSLASLAASLQHAARFAPASIPYAAVDPQMVTGVLSGRRAACLRLCIELREKFKPDF
eukprot:1139054-Pelagomonas_calceolata.AAC.4